MFALGSVATYMSTDGVRQVRQRNLDRIRNKARSLSLSRVSDLSELSFAFPSEQSFGAGEVRRSYQLEAKNTRQTCGIAEAFIGTPEVRFGTVIVLGVKLRSQEFVIESTGSFEVAFYLDGNPFGKLIRAAAVSENVLDAVDRQGSRIAQFRCKRTVVLWNSMRMLYQGQTLAFPLGRRDSIVDALKCIALLPLFFKRLRKNLDTVIPVPVASEHRSVIFCSSLFFRMVEYPFDFGSSE
jgi:hypothetical protein